MGPTNCSPSHSGLYLQMMFFRHPPPPSPSLPHATDLKRRGFNGRRKEFRAVNPELKFCLFFTYQRWDLGQIPQCPGASIASPGMWE